MKKLLTILLLLLSISACEEENILQHRKIYINSFESMDDVVEWVGAYRLSDDTPPTGGDSSLVVSGGCVVPHIYFEYGPFPEETPIFISIYGKTITLYGSIAIMLKEDRTNYRYLHIKEPKWTYYETDRYLIYTDN